MVWKSLAGTKYCTLGGLLNTDKRMEIKRGKPVSELTPGTHFKMSKSFPKQIALSDSLSNLDLMLVISSRLKEFLYKRNLPNVEFHSVLIHNLKGQVEPDHYYVTNPTQIIDCIDTDQSNIKWNPADPTLISGCLKLVMKPGSFDDDCVIFRPKFLEHFIILNPMLAEEIVANGFTGMKFIPTNAFTY